MDEYIFLNIECDSENFSIQQNVISRNSLLLAQDPFGYLIDTSVQEFF